jgi:hypothetical protein
MDIMQGGHSIYWNLEGERDAQRKIAPSSELGEKQSLGEGEELHCIYREERVILLIFIRFVNVDL